MSGQWATTSDMRVALCSAICAKTYTSTADWKRWLAASLDALPFERMTDQALIEMAHTALGAERANEIIASHDDQRREIVERGYLCPTCLDQRVVEEPDTGRWDRCPRCNPRPEREATT